MKLRLFLLSVSTLFFIHSKAQDIINTTERVVKLFAEHEYEDITYFFSEELKIKSTISQTGYKWYEVEKRLESFDSICNIDVLYNKEDNFRPYTVTTLAFKKDWVSLELYFDSLGNIYKFFFNPNARRTFLYVPPFDPASRGIEEDSLLLQLPHYTSQAIYCHTKKQKKKQPLVVFVHGSGPVDMDGSIGATKIYKEFAWHLASHGIASIRFNKGTYENKNYFAKLKDSITVDAEVTDEVRGVLEALKKRGIASEFIIVGHSLGAIMGPKIASENKSVKALALLAAPGRPLEDIIPFQLRHIFTEDSLTSDEALYLVYEEQKILNVKSLDSNSKYKPGQLALGLPASYWLSLKHYDMVGTAKKLTIPVLVMQGEVDYQVSMTDYEILKKHLTAPNFSFISFPELNHGFIHVGQKSTSKDYNKPRNVDPAAAAALVEWIKKIK